MLYVTGFGRGVFKSTDGGRSWTMKDTGITQKESFAWRLARDRNSVLYLVIARRSDPSAHAAARLRGPVGHAQPVEESPVGGAAPQEHVLPRVDGEPVSFEGRRRPTQPRLGLDQGHSGAAVGTGERAQTAPLGRAVIGGLMMATLATLMVLPAVYTFVQARVRTLSPTLDPDDPASTHYEPRK